jgi:hypothetical protein
MEQVLDEFEVKNHALISSPPAKTLLWKLKSGQIGRAP